MQTRWARRWHVPIRSACALPLGLALRPPHKYATYDHTTRHTRHTHRLPHATHMQRRKQASTNTRNHYHAHLDTKFTIKQSDLIFRLRSANQPKITPARMSRQRPQKNIIGELTIQNKQLMRKLSSQLSRSLHRCISYCRTVAQTLPQPWASPPRPSSSQSAPPLKSSLQDYE